MNEWDERDSRTRAVVADLNMVVFPGVSILICMMMRVASFSDDFKNRKRQSHMKKKMSVWPRSARLYVDDNLFD